MLKYILSLAGSYQGPVLAKDAILLDKTRAVLWHNYKNRIWQKEREKKTGKKNKQWNDRKRHEPCKSLWLVALEIPSEIGQSQFKHPLDKLEDNSYRQLIINSIS